MSVTNEIIIIFVLILMNGVLAMSELAIVSSRKARLHQWSNEGDKGARVALDIANAPNDFLSTLQIGITLIGIFAGAFGGATITDNLADHFEKFPGLAGFSDGLAMAIVVSLITYFSLILGELVPKRLALHNPELIAKFVARPMQILSIIAKPAVLLLSASTNFVLSILRVREGSEPSVTGAEIKVLVEQAADAGVVEESEQEMVHSVLSLNDRKVHSIMTPRKDVIWLEASMSREEILEVLDNTSQSRFPVCEESLDHVLGLIHAKTILRRCVDGLPIDLRSMVSQPAYIPESTNILHLLDDFRLTKQDIALVMNEYGGLEGMVSRSDLLEEIVGKLPSQDEAPEWQSYQRDDGSWVLDGQMPIDDFRELIGLESLPSEAAVGYHTLAGLILFHISRIPQAGDSFDWESVRFEIIDMDGYRIDKVLVRRLEPGSEVDSTD